MHFIISNYYYFFAALHGIWDLSSSTRTESVPPEIEVQSLNHWDAKEVPNFNAFKFNLWQGGYHNGQCSEKFTLASKRSRSDHTAKSANLAAQSFCPSNTQNDLEGQSS